MLRLPPSFRRQCRTPAGRLVFLCPCRTRTADTAGRVPCKHKHKHKHKHNPEHEHRRRTRGPERQCSTVGVGCWSSLPSAWPLTILTTWTRVIHHGEGHGEHGHSTSASAHIKAVTTATPAPASISIVRLASAALAAERGATDYRVFFFLSFPLFILFLRRASWSLGRVTAKPLRGPAARLGLGPDWSLPSLDSTGPSAPANPPNTNTRPTWQPGRPSPGAGGHPCRPSSF